jgi:hypothetical protein
MKPGYKTTEFWISLLVLILGVLAGSGVVTDGGAVAKVTGFATSTLAALGYTWARATTKLGPKKEE